MMVMIVAGPVARSAILLVMIVAVSPIQRVDKLQTRFLYHASHHLLQQFLHQVQVLMNAKLLTVFIVQI